MVKYSKICLLVFLLGVCFGALCLAGCNVDLIGFFGSTDLATRLKEKDNFRFLSDQDRAPSLGDEYSFLVLTDTHIEDGDAFGLEKLKNIVEQNNEIKFVVFTGDITQYGSVQDLEKFIEIARSLGVPCYPVIGNHDFYFGNWTVWKNRIGSTRYRINGDTTALFILDSANSFIGNDQLDWLERELKTTHNSGIERVFVFTHSNIFVESIADMQRLSSTKERARLISILRNKCDIMFTGHVHERRIGEMGNVKYVTIEDYNSKHIYCLVSVSKNGIELKFEEL